MNSLIEEHIKLQISEFKKPAYSKPSFWLALIGASAGIIGFWSMTNERIEYNSLRIAHMNLEKALDDKKSNYNNLENKHKKLQASSKKTEQNKKLAEQKLNAIMSELTMTLEQHSNVQEKLSIKSKKLKKIKNELDRVLEDYGLLNGKYTRISSDAANLTKEIFDSKQEIEKLGKKKTETEDEISRLYETSRGIVNNIDELKRKEKDIKERFSDYTVDQLIELVSVRTAAWKRSKLIKKYKYNWNVYLTYPKNLEQKISSLILDVHYELPLYNKDNGVLSPYSKLMEQGSKYFPASFNANEKKFNGKAIITIEGEAKPRYIDF